MIVEYCLNIDVQLKDKKQIKEIKGGSYGDLEEIAKAAITIPCVTRVEVSETDTGVHGDTFCRTRYEAQNPKANDYYTTEESFQENLKRHLKNDHLYRLYTGEYRGVAFIHGGGWLF